MFVIRVLATAALATLSLGSAQAQPAAPVQVINLASYSFSPAPIVLHAGIPVTLQFVNRAGKGHDFTAKLFFRSARILAGSVEGGEIELRPGQTANVTLIPAAGRYNVRCSHAFHNMLGMHTTILVQ
ncbi:cupredoxin domain-containing protein [Sphingomonas sp.]|uniref:cupredoxin domain-containing protein n=1 Tax=Sphingomonas sp. TaxID=28214 RepID=UPI00286D0C06|nr:cupredoxin domain-containing protein [Sphingomonas sp.]